jgi:hypothetical protein
MTINDQEDGSDLPPFMAEPEQTETTDEPEQAPAPVRPAMPDVRRNMPQVAEQVYTKVLLTLHTSGVKPEERSHDGEMGYIWNGSLLGILTELWPNVARVGDDPRALHARKEINGHLRRTHNMVCIDPGYAGGRSPVGAPRRSPVWWIRTTWNPAPPVDLPRGLTRTERKLTRVEAGEHLPPAPVSVRLVKPARHHGQFPCPEADCNETFPSETGRNHHKVYHVTHQRLIVRAASILRGNGDDANALRLGEVTPGIIHRASLARHFRTKYSLIEAARAYMERSPEQEEEENDPVSEIPTVPRPVMVQVPDFAEDFPERLLDVVGFMHHAGMPLTHTGVMSIAVNVSRPDRAAAVAALLDDGRMLTGMIRDVNNRPYTVYLPATPWQAPDDDGAVPPVPVVAADHRGALVAALAAYDKMQRDLSDARTDLEELREATSDNTGDQQKIEDLEARLADTVARLARMREVLG